MQMPKHIGIILDGNRRWARARGLTTFQGHKKGYDNVKNISEYFFNSGGEILSVYAFSTENWNRSKSEVGYLMRLLKRMVVVQGGLLGKRGIKLKVVGDKNRLGKDLQVEIKKAEEKTKNGKKGLLNICINYGGREEIIFAVNELLKGMTRLRSSKRDSGGQREMTEKEFKSYLRLGDIPDPDLIIRTSGEQRLSGFLTWQSVYSELFFVKKHWPAFGPRDLDKVVKEFNQRNRRFGGN